MISDFVQLFLKLPLWMAPLGAAAIYAILAWVPRHFEHGPGPHMLAPLLGAIAPWAAGLVLLTGVLGAVNRWIDRLGPARRGRGRSTSGTAPATAPETSSSTSAPSCPRCGGGMERKTARRGASAGQDFWGCDGYPRCRGTRP